MKKEYSVMSQKGERLLDKKQFKKAQILYDKIVQQFPQEFFGWYNRGFCMLALEETEEATLSFEKALLLRPEDPFTLNQLSLLRFKNGNLIEAEKLILKALQFDPNNAEIHNTRGIVAFNQQDYPLARSEFTKALQLNPQFTAAKLNLEDCFEFLRTGETDSS